MNTYIKQKNFIELKSKLSKIFPQLTDADLSYSETNEKDMLRMVAYKLRKTKEEMQEIISKL
jgi:hypothetical protein